MTSRPGSDSFSVWIGDRRAGTIHRFSDRTRFSLDLDYREDPGRPVLGLVFEDRPDKVHVASVRVAPWFSNLLPESRLRDWIARERDVSPEREMELLAQVGRDLPGAVRILAEDEAPLEPDWNAELDTYAIDLADDFHHSGYRFSLAGVAMKFSMVKTGKQFVLPARGEGGDWIVKTPDAVFRDVPVNEFTMMTLAGAVGIEVPEIRLVPKAEVDERLPDSVWPGNEEFAYAIRRFDRDERRGRIHIEDLAQVRNIYAELKDKGNFETVASLIYRGRDTDSLLEFTRRLTFDILVSNGDHHLKNWSLIYPGGRIPKISPAYDIVSTAHYFEGIRVEDLALKFGGHKEFHRVRLGAFRRLQERLGARDVDLAECAALTVERTLGAWPNYASLLDSNPRLQEAVGMSIIARGKTLLRTLG
jgi:serine/threonine-protein kinase HipA